MNCLRIEPRTSGLSDKFSLLRETAEEEREDGRREIGREEENIYLYVLHMSGIMGSLRNYENQALRESKPIQLPLDQHREAEQ